METTTPNARYIPNVPWYFPLILSIILAIIAGFLVDSTLTHRKMEKQRNNDYVARVEAEKIRLVETIIDQEKAIVLTDPNLKILLANIKFAHLVEKKKSEIIGKNLRDFIDITYDVPFEGIPQYQKQLTICLSKKPNQKTLLDVNLLGVERTWAVKNDGYLVITFSPREEVIISNK